MPYWVITSRYSQNSFGNLDIEIIADRIKQTIDIDEIADGSLTIYSRLDYPSQTLNLAYIVSCDKTTARKLATRLSAHLYFETESNQVNKEMRYGISNSIRSRETLLVGLGNFIKYGLFQSYLSGEASLEFLMSQFPGIVEKALIYYQMDGYYIAEDTDPPF